MEKGMEKKEVLKMEQVSYSYVSRGERTEVLEDADAVFERGKLYAVMGPSGSGKTTTLMLLGGLEEPEKGSVLYEGKKICGQEAQGYRTWHTSMVFQAYNLFPYLTARENVEVSMEIVGKKQDRRKRAEELLTQMGIGPELHRKLVGKLSGGEQQRVAIARALAKDADIVLADEPTGNLDEKNAAVIQELFRKIAHEMGKCVIVATHSAEFAKKADQVLRMKHKRFTVVEE